MTVTVIGSVPYWDQYFNEQTPQSYWTDGTYLYDDVGINLGPIDGATAAVAGSTDTSSQSVVSQLVDVLPAIATGWNTLQLTNINTQRAKQGLPALNMTSYGPQVGLSLSAQTQQMILWGALGLGLVIFMSRRSR